MVIKRTKPPDSVSVEKNKYLPCKLGAEAGAEGVVGCGVGGARRLLGTWSPGAEAALVAVLKPGALYRADLTGPAGTVFVPVIDGSRGSDPARCSSSDYDKVKISVTL